MMPYSGRFPSSKTPNLLLKSGWGGRFWGNLPHFPRFVCAGRTTPLLAAMDKGSILPRSSGAESIPLPLRLTTCGRRSGQAKLACVADTAEPTFLPGW